MKQTRGTPGDAGLKPKAPTSMLGRAWRRTRFVAGGPIANIGLEDISSGARLIGQLAKQMRQRPLSDGRLKADEHGGIDLRATAFSYGISVEELLERMHERRRQTARSSYALFCLGGCFLVVWLWQAMHMPRSAARIVSALEFLPFCVLFLLVATKSAHSNWQLRTRRLGSLGDYLRTSDPFLPR